MDRTQGLQQAIKAAGGLVKLARAIGRPKQTVWNWATQGRPPVKACPMIEAVTGVPCEELRPDINWSYMRQKLGVE